MSINIGDNSVLQIHTPSGWLNKIKDLNDNVIWEAQAVGDDSLCISTIDENSNNYVYIQVYNDFNTPVTDVNYTFSYKNIMFPSYMTISTNEGKYSILGNVIFLKSVTPPASLPSNCHISIGCKRRQGSNFDLDNDPDVRFVLSGKVSSLGSQGNELSLNSGVSYSRLFRNSSVIDASNLQITFSELHQNFCFYGMFEGCTLLTNAPNLPATQLSTGCYLTMFYGCTSLTNAQIILPATTLTESCYNQMFSGCTLLTTAPELPATILSYPNCYYSMFDGCENLNYIKCLGDPNTIAFSSTDLWVNNVALSGTFYCATGMSNLWTTGINGIPYGWNVIEV